MYRLTWDMQGTYAQHLGYVRWYAVSHTALCRLLGFALRRRDI
jgi:hypothetical protein